MQSYARWPKEVIVRAHVEERFQKALIADPHAFWLISRGTIEGARAAWGCILRELVRREGLHQESLERQSTRTLIDKYRRELEAMKR